MSRQVNTWPDPNITIGPYRILPRTDGNWIAYDERLPIGQRTAALATSKDLAVKEAEQLVKDATQVTAECGRALMLPSRNALAVHH